MADSATLIVGCRFEDVFSLKSRWVGRRDAGLDLVFSWHVCGVMAPECIETPYSRPELYVPGLEVAYEQAYCPQAVPNQCKVKRIVGKIIGVCSEKEPVLPIGKLLATDLAAEADAILRKAGYRGPVIPYLVYTEGATK